MNLEKSVEGTIKRAEEGLDDELLWMPGLSQGVSRLLPLVEGN